MLGEAPNTYEILVPAKDPLEDPLDNSSAEVKDVIGAIYNVFGGGNAAKVIGTPHVKVGTQEYVEITTNLSDVRGYCTRTGGAGTQASPYTYSEPITGENAVTPTANTSYYKKVEGVDIRGNIYGGGNNAEVQGDTDVVIGKAAPTTP